MGLLAWVMRALKTGPASVPPAMERRLETCWEVEATVDRSDQPASYSNSPAVTREGRVEDLPSQTEQSSLPASEPELIEDPFVPGQWIPREALKGRPVLPGVCSKCEGTGLFPYPSRFGNHCFECNGTGRSIASFEPE